LYVDSDSDYRNVCVILTVWRFNIIFFYKVNYSGLVHRRSSGSFARLYCLSCVYDADRPANNNDDNDKQSQIIYDTITRLWPVTRKVCRMSMTFAFCHASLHKYDPLPPVNNSFSVARRCITEIHNFISPFSKTVFFLTSLFSYTVCVCVCVCVCRVARGPWVFDFPPPTPFESFGQVTVLSRVLTDIKHALFITYYIVR